MAEFKDFLYSMVITIGLMGIFAYFISGVFVNNSQTIPSSFNQTLTLMTNRTGLEKNINSTKTGVFKTEGTSSEYSLFDIVGFWFQQGWQTLKLIPESLSIFQSMIFAGSASLAETPLAPVVIFIRFILVNIVLIGIILLLLSVLLKWEL